MHGGSVIGAIGKVPQYAEFVRVRPHGDLATSFETWLASGLEWGHMRHGDAWRKSFEQGAPYAFVWTHRSQPDAALCGIIAPSRDAVGRSYPITVFAVVPTATFGDAPHVIPLAFGDFFDQAYQVLHPGGAPASGQEPGRLATPGIPFDQALSWLQVPGYDSITAAATEYANWCAGSAPDQAWLPLFAEGTKGAERALSMLALAIEPFRGVERPPTKLGARLSLGAGGAGAAVVWLDVIRRMARWRGTVPACFWSMQTQALLVHFGDVPQTTLAELWMPDSDNESLVPVDGTQAAHHAPHLAQWVGGAFRETHTSFADVLHALTS